MIYCERITQEMKVKELVMREEFFVNSSDGVHMIHGYRWYDPGMKIKGVLQIVHGMLEYIDRYGELAEYMASSGYFVIGHDHLGHGESVSDPKELGYVGKHGAVLWLRDIELIRRMATACAPKVPYILLGHSMGSFLVRRYLIYHGKRVDGAVLMGTGHQSAILVKAGIGLTYLSMLKGGSRGHNRFLNNMTCSGYAKRYPDNAHTGSWLSRDPQVLVSALQDPKMNFEFTLNAFEALFRTVEESVDPRRAAKMPMGLPLLILSGDEDPVGGNGKGVRRFETMLRQIGMQCVTCILYPKNRHELIHDLGKERVMKDILGWCSRIEKREVKG